MRASGLNTRVTLAVRVEADLLARVPALIKWKVFPIRLKVGEGDALLYVDR